MTSFRTSGIVAAIALGLVLAATSTAWAQESYTVDASHTDVLVRGKHADLAYAYGIFLKPSGTFVYDPSDVSKSHVAFTVQAESLFTGDEARDRRLVGGDLLDAKKFPTISFESTKVEAVGGETLRITGKLTLHGKTSEIALLAEMTGSGKGPDGKQRRGFFASFDLDPGAFGLDELPAEVGETIHVVITTEGILQDGGASAP